MHYRITDVEELHQSVEEEWDHLDQEVIENAISEWRKQATHSLCCSQQTTF